MRGRSLIILLGAAFALAACGAAEPETQAAEGPLVAIVAVAPANASGAVRASGMVGYRREPVLAFAAPGVIASINVDIGDTVRRGQRLATLRRTTAGSNPDEAAMARANAERDLARAEELYARGFVSEARLEDARLAVQRASDSAALTAPTDGIILRRAAEPSQTVAAGAPILVIGESSSGIIVRASVASSDAARIRIGDAAQVRVADVGGAPLTGRVTRAAAQGDQATGAFEIEVEVGAPGALRSGMVAEVEIAATPREGAQDALLAPTLALLDARADQGVVFVVDTDGVARRRAVRTAGVTQEGVLIVEGLAAGERIVAAGAAYVRDGEPVRIAPAS